MNKEEYEKRKKELQEKLKNAKDEELQEIRKEIEEFKKIEIQEDETVNERNLLRINSKIDEKSKIIKKNENEEEKMNRSEILASKEYRSAWAKKLMGYKSDEFTEKEKRALGDAITTTATEYTESTETVEGINNGGLFIPTSVRTELLELISEQSPIFRDVRKLQIQGNIDLPYLFSHDDAEWYVETTETKNGATKYQNLQLTGWELARDIVITWKLEKMATEQFISFILVELAERMGKAIVNAIIYGNGEDKPTGITNGLTSITTGDTPVDTILNTYKSLSNEDRIGAKAYISTDVMLDIVSYKDANGNYPFLQGVPTNKIVSIEKDPYLNDNDIIVGNPQKYILNINEDLRIDKENSIKGRKVTYGAYTVIDGKPKPNAFAYGQYTPSA